MAKLSNPLSLIYAFIGYLFLTASKSAQNSASVSPWGWVLILVIFLALIVLIWWFFRSSRKSPVTPPSIEPAPIASIPHTAPEPDNLTIIEGIGPKIAQVLQSAGILTFDQLAASDPTYLRELLEQGDLRLADPISWPEQAKLAAAGDNAGLLALQSQLKGGRN